MPGFLSLPLSLYSIPVVWFTAFLPAALKTVEIAGTTGYNNIAPRGNTQRLAAAAGIPKEISARVARMEGAHQNGMEQLPIWFAAIIVGNFVGLEHSTLNKASFFYIITRILYNFVYINQKTRAQSSIRSLLFFVSLSAPMYLLIKAANKAYAAGL